MKAKLARARGHFKAQVEDATQEVRSLFRQVETENRKLIGYTIYCNLWLLWFILK